MYEYSVIDIIRIVDGDTVDVLLDLGFDIHRKERVRILGIDAPETRTTDENEKKFGVEAKAYVVSWFAKHPKITVRTTKDDKYSRILGEFFDSEGLNLSHCIVEDGYAWEYDGTTKVKDYALLLERRADPTTNASNENTQSP